jgi:ABC-type phosphate transport system ATPase subunit
VTALIGPSGCGKSTLLRSFNRMHDLSPDARIEGKLFLEDLDLYDKRNSVTAIRNRIGMVFQKPNPLPKSIYENLSYALNIHNYPKTDGIKKKVDTLHSFISAINNRIQFIETYIETGSANSDRPKERLDEIATQFKSNI